MYFLLIQLSDNEPSNNRPTKEQLINGDYWYIPSNDDEIMSNDLWDKRANEVKEAAKHIWTNYERICLGKDEISPLNGGCNDRWGGTGMMLNDNLDTLYILNMSDLTIKSQEYVLINIYTS